jgi:3'-phosphoadenosine 5'-phosphosulfate sulfotransferase
MTGIQRLLAAQKSDGSWGDYSDAHPERRTLHTTMLAAHALISAYDMDGFFHTDLPNNCSTSVSIQEPSNSSSSETSAVQPSWHALLDGLPSYKTHSSGGRVQIYDSFLSEDEAEELRDLGMKLLLQANQTNLEYRKAGFRRQIWWKRSPALRRVRERVARLTGIPFEEHEEPPMYAWSSGSKVKHLHHDQNANPRRYLTVILYLNTVSGCALFDC